MNSIEDSAEQLRAVGNYFDGLADRMDRVPEHCGAQDAPGSHGEEEAACAAG